MPNDEKTSNEEFLNALNELLSDRYSESDQNYLENSNQIAHPPVIKTMARQERKYNNYRGGQHQPNRNYSNYSNGNNNNYNRFNNNNNYYNNRNNYNRYENRNNNNNNNNKRFHPFKRNNN